MLRKITATTLIVLMFTALTFGTVNAQASAYQDNGNGTVTDANTGLTWQQTPDFVKRSWQDAIQYCDTLSLAGQSDWRLPSVTELYSIHDVTVGWPYLDTTYFDNQFDQERNFSQYWSSTHYEVGTTHGGQDTAFGVNFASGHIKGYPIVGTLYVRCVRGGAYGANAFVTNGDGTVTDTASGLVWQQADDGVARSWGDAIAYCEDLTLAGYDDWRLPNHKELQFIVDYSGVYPAIDSAYFSIVDADGWFWTDTPAYGSPWNADVNVAWYVAFGYATDSSGEDLHGAGAVRFAPQTSDLQFDDFDEVRYSNYVRCVRGYNAALSVGTEFSGETAQMDAPQNAMQGQQGPGSGQPPSQGGEGGPPSGDGPPSQGGQGGPPPGGGPPPQS
ncbi:MAG: DUF1566 domain-containing protein [Chloroflexi bacterium]|nr:DUF1566 domain-containing protein [Chloroflexota bacterium]